MKVFGDPKKEKADEKRETFHQAQRRESLRGRKAQESKSPRPEVKLGKQEGERLIRWEKHAEAPVQGLEVLQKSARA
jgi:hypothetical protein